MADYTPLDEITTIYNTLQTTFASNRTHPIPWRVHQLRQLALFAQENAEALCDSLFVDLGKPKQEVLMAEIGPVIERCLKCAEEVGAWSRTDVVQGVPDWQKGWGARVEKRAKGVALIIAPWNYPIILSLQPLYGAIAAGCCAVVKPSEIAPTYASLLANLLPKYLDATAYRVVHGGVPSITKLLELKWDHIFYTGNGRVGRIISTAAAKHLTPLTLELGGKSPVIIDPATCGDLELAAKRIIWGKINNAGQICIAPDYVLIPTAAIADFVSALAAALATFFPHGALNTSQYGRIVSPLHFQRLKALLLQTKGKIVVGGKMGEGGEDSSKRGIEPTVVVVEEGDVLLDDELFGPILPVIGVNSVADAIHYVRKRDHPLVLYAFTEDETVKQIISNNTMSGNLVFNDTFQQLSVEELPFGGVGESGYGRQVMKYSFDQFTYERSVLDIPQSAEPTLTIRYPPHTAESLEFFSAPLKIKIPATTSTTTAAPKINGFNAVNGVKVNGHAHGRGKGHGYVEGPISVGLLGSVVGGNTAL